MRFPSGVLGGGGQDFCGGVGRAGADALDYSRAGGRARDAEFAFWVDEFGHCRRGDEYGKAGCRAEDCGACGDGADVAHDPGAKPDAGEDAAVGVAGDEVVGGGGVEGPGFRGRGFTGGVFEVVEVDDGGEGGLLLVFLFRCGFGGGRGFEPFVRDGGGVYFAFQV